MWKLIEENPKYEVSDSGEIRNVASGRFVNQHRDRNGYNTVNLSVRHGKTIYRRVGRLVAAAFIPNPDGLPQVNHIDEDKTNDSVSNLEWCDCKYNINYGSRTDRAIAHCKKPVIAFKEGKEVARYESASAAARALSLWQGDISACCRGERHYKTVGGFGWAYAKG